MNKKVYICSPLSGDIEGNIKKAQKYCRNAFAVCGVIPYAPHIYFTQFLDDTKPEDREVGLACGMEWLKECDELWVFGEPSKGMKAEIDWWISNTNKPIYNFRAID